MTWLSTLASLLLLGLLNFLQYNFSRNIFREGVSENVCDVRQKELGGVCFCSKLLLMYSPSCTEIYRCVLLHTHKTVFSSK